MTKILVTGANGQLAKCIQDLAFQFPHLEFHFKDKNDLDITNQSAVSTLFSKIRFDYCINCAAYTAVDKAEKESNQAESINVIGTKNLTASCNASDTVLIYISTDFVYDGSSTLPYKEKDLTNPLNIYGRTKLLGEQEVQKTKKHFIFRTSWLFSEHGSNFLKTMLVLSDKNKEINVVNDQSGNPTYAKDLAKALLKIIEEKNTKYGIYNFSNEGIITWYEFAFEIFKQSKKSVQLNPIPTSQFPTPAKRPKNSALNKTKAIRELQIEVRSWKEALKEALFRLNNTENLIIAIEAAITAGQAIMEVYNSDISVEYKDDQSPLTQADKNANNVINSYLLPTNIPIISEENKQLEYDIRKNWNNCWIVDPVDGTKEFIKRNGEFTVNIALVKNGMPKLGVIYAPALKTLYYANVEQKEMFKVILENHIFNPAVIFAKTERILNKTSNDKLTRVVGSRSHMNKETLDFVNKLNDQGKSVEIVSKGSSLKFCLVAEGLADVYPRFAPTMEWDTAAGQAICEAVGVNVISKKTDSSLLYNKENLLNPWFIVARNK